ncbi:MAG: ABC transporter ATP-binding protein [Hydrogenophaga sp.]|uniref:ABC transporter ATP-binding protein n=1 Tax=Hydrogenophaga sp. TaxID=1904254 RepID=UPI0040375763
MPNALEVRNLSVSYRGGIEALWSVDLDIEQGTMVALLGANGAGKTTILRAVSGMLGLEQGRIMAGTVRVFGESLQHLPPHKVVRHGLFHVREGRHVFGEMSVEDNLIAATYARASKAPTSAFDEIYEYFPRLGERRKQLAGYLSGGEQQMLALGRAIIADPRLVLLDEPSLGLAPKIIREIFEIIARIQAEKRLSILVVEQNASIALKYASQAYVIQNGRVVMQGSAREIQSSETMSALYLGGGVSHGAPARTEQVLEAH